MVKYLRVKCTNCQEISNIPVHNNTCPKCKNPIPVSGDACIYLYRQGSPYGVAGGFGIYINGAPYGHIGNKETVCMPLPYGTYNIHCAVGMSRSCKDLQVTLTPENRQAFTKVHICPGFWSNSFVIEPMDPKLLNL